MDLRALGYECVDHKPGVRAAARVFYGNARSRSWLFDW